SEAHLGVPTASSPLKTEYNLGNDSTGLTSTMRSYSSTSIKSAAGSQNVDSPSSGFGGGGAANQSMGDVSIDDGNVASQSEAELAAEKRQSSKFVYKLFRMVSDPDYQHLISWNRNGTSVMVCNFDEFAKEVLGKHFKHSNFSSFIRQLNMYGFYKVNKTPRGHRQSVDAQIWEFSHPKFLRGRSDLLDDIRRKALDSEHARVEARDLQYSVSVGQMQLRALTRTLLCDQASKRVLLWWTHGWCHERRTTHRRQRPMLPWRSAMRSPIATTPPPTMPLYTRQPESRRATMHTTSWRTASAGCGSTMMRRSDSCRPTVTHANRTKARASGASCAPRRNARASADLLRSQAV
ncbi:hypothetical protein OOU_Y34scaffold01119g1, partial [Pyricularia oryzae Y34]